MKKQWRSLEALQDSAEYREQHRPEFPENAEFVEMDGVSRRKFLGAMGASMALAGIAGTGCIRKPVEHILPYTNRPEHIIPGTATHYRTAMVSGAGVLGIQVETHEGRPTKIEANPDHPMNNPVATGDDQATVTMGGGRTYGATNSWAQAAVLDLYDPDRSRHVMHAGAESTWAAWWEFAAEHFTGLTSADGVGVLIEGRPEPTLLHVLNDFKRLTSARVFRHDALSTANREEGLQTVGLDRHNIIYDLSSAERIVSLDADFLGTQGDTVRNSALFAAGRRVENPGDGMSRLYVVEPTLTVTGASADNRLRLRASQIAAFGRALVAEIARRSGEATPYDLRNALHVDVENQTATEWAEAIADDLMDSHVRGKSVIIVGDRQPAWLHALAHLANSLLGNVGNTVSYNPDRETLQGESLGDLSTAIAAGQIKTLLIVGGNPAYTAPADVGFASKLGRIETSIHLSRYVDETSALCSWHVPISHFLEAWGDVKASDGTLTVQQPMIAPLLNTRSELELLAHLVRYCDSTQYADEREASDPEGDFGYQLVRHRLATAYPTDNFETSWRRWLHDGLVADAAQTEAPASFDWTTLTAALPVAEEIQIPAAATGYEVDFAADYSVYDGRQANNGWLQETPDPVSKLTWDNAALIGTDTAEELEIEKGDLVTVRVGSASLTLPAWIVPAAAKGAITLHLGYGREWGRISEGAGSNAYLLRSSDGLGFADASLSKAEGSKLLANTQDHNSMIPRPGFEPRPLVRETTPEAYAAHPHFVEDLELVDHHHMEEIGDLFVPTNPTDGQQWAMAIDLNACTGCSACVVACTAENNIPIVGRERVMDGREMQWLRIDRYFTSQSTPNMGDGHGGGHGDDHGDDHGDEHADEHGDDHGDEHGDDHADEHGDDHADEHGDDHGDGHGDDHDETPDPTIFQMVTQPLPCQQCEKAPCETVCPVGATTHTPEGLNDMAYNRCIGTRYCSNNCPYKVRRFNYFNYVRENDESSRMNRLGKNPNVTMRFRGVMEKCTYCVQRITAAKIAEHREGGDMVPDGAIIPACAQACASKAITFGDKNDESSMVAAQQAQDRNYVLLRELNDSPRTSYLAMLRNPNPVLAGVA